MDRAVRERGSYVFGRFRLDAARRALTRDGATVALTPTVFDTLLHLVENPARVVTKEELFAAIWPGRFVEEANLTQTISTLRKALNEAGDDGRLIATAPGRGYRFTAEVDLAPVAASPVAPRSSASQAAVHKLSICVLPFSNLSDDPQQEYFSDGVSEDIITDLAKVSALSVVARNTAFTFKGKSVKVPDVARELGVSHVLEGSVRKVGARVRISAQLIDGAAGDHIWAERYDRDLTDIFALQDEISEAIVKVLKLKLLPEAKQAIERRGTDSLEAYDLYLMARSYYLTGNSGDPRREEAMERLCHRAVEIDPGYALAWALMATAQFNLRRIHGQAGDLGQAAIERALALDPDLAEARALKAGLLAETGRNDEAATEIAHALRLDPESFDVNYHAGSISYDRGRLAEAVPYFENAAALIEKDLAAPAMLISCYTALGDEENLRRVANIALGRAEKTVAQDRSNGTAMGRGVSALAALGETERAKDWMKRALLIDPDNLVMRYNMACCLSISLKDPAAAMDMLGSALERDAGGLLRDTKFDPDFAGLHEDARFQAMVAAAEARLATGEAGPPLATRARSS